MLHRALTGSGIAALALALGASAASAAGLDAFRAPATPKNVEKIAAAGFDAGEGISKDGRTIDIVATESQARALKIGARKIAGANAATPAQAAAAAAARPARRNAVDDATASASDEGFDVWTKYDAFDEEAANEEDGLEEGDDDFRPTKEQYEEQYDRVVAENPGLVARRSTGTTYGGRDITAIQVTKDATGADIPNRPAVLYNAMQHAREWLAGETCRRSLEWVLDNYGKTTVTGKEVTALVDSTELWFVCVNNPDGYEYTFTKGNRIWRKNLRDNNGNGTIEAGDGVDPNRNFARNWGLDDEGSSPDPADETYRGPSAASEPETKAMEGLFNEIHPVFQKNDHTAAQLLLYPQGFIQDAPTADNEIFTALAGDPFQPGIEGFLPELSAGLYITNGDFTDWAYATQKTLSYTPEGTAAEDPEVSVFEYPDSPLQVQQEFQRHLPFIRDLAKTADDPTNVESHLGNKARPIVVSTFPVSYGDPQLVQATLQRKLGPAELRFKVNGGPAQKVPTSEWAGGKRYGKDDAVYYHRVRGAISGTNPGDSVEAWFVAGGVESEHFTYAAKVESTKPVLLLANEDYSGIEPSPIPGQKPVPVGKPTYLDTYRGLLDAAGIAYDVYDVDERGAQFRTAPDDLGVLSHYSHVVWYTGDDYVTRADGGPGGSIDKLAVDTQNRVRDFLNEGGKLFYTGQNAGRQFAENYLYNPFQKEEGEYCNTSAQCIAVQDDFLQYWLGANTYIGDAGLDEDGNTLPVAGVADPFGPGPYQLEDSHTATFLVTSSIYDPIRYPQFKDSKKALTYQRPGGSPFDPTEGQYFMAAGTTNQSYRRLTKTVNLAGKSAAELSFKASYDLEEQYDFLFVEAHTVGQDDWTTLQEENGETDVPVTTPPTPVAGYSCESAAPNGSNWQEDHPFLAHYQTKQANGTCVASGSTGKWFAATGNSGGYKTWQVPIPPAYLGKNVELSITVVSDAAVQGLGTWVDEAKLTSTPAGAGDFATSFETADLGGFVAGPYPAGEKVPSGAWTRTTSAPFVESPGVSTPATFFTGFGLEKIQGSANQLALLRDVFEHLGAPTKPAIPATPPVPVDPPVVTPPTPPVITPPVITPPVVTPPGLKPIGLRFLQVPRQQLKTVRSRGLLVQAGCTTGCKVAVEVRITRATARKLRLRSIIVGKRTLTIGVNGNGRVKFSTTALKRLPRRGSLALTVIGTVTGDVQRKKLTTSVRLK